MTSILGRLAGLRFPQATFLSEGYSIANLQEDLEEQRRALAPLLHQLYEMRATFGIETPDDRHLAPGVHLTWGEWRRILEAFEE